jgi:hypothetical protein
MRRRFAKRFFEDDDLCVNVATAGSPACMPDHHDHLHQALFFMMYAMDYMKHIGLDLHSPFMGGGHELL